MSAILKHEDAALNIMVKAVVFAILTLANDTEKLPKDTFMFIVSRHFQTFGKSMRVSRCSNCWTRTGVSKSTLIDSVFQGNFATTGQGRPVTQNTREIKKEGIPPTSAEVAEAFSQLSTTCWR